MKLAEPIKVINDEPRNIEVLALTIYGPRDRRPPSAVHLAGGATSRLKRLHVGGDSGTIAAALARTIEAAP